MGISGKTYFQYLPFKENYFLFGVQRKYCDKETRQCENIDCGNNVPWNEGTFEIDQNFWLKWIIKKNAIELLVNIYFVKVWINW